MSRMLAVDGCYFRVLDDQQKNLNGYYGFNERIAAVLQSTDFSIGELRDALLKNEPVIINQIRNNGDAVNTVLQQQKYRSLLAVPVSTSNDPEGLMLVATLTKHFFSPLEVNLFKAIAREMAYAIKNVHLFEEASKARALQELDTMRTELLANVSHELRTPLAAIKGFASSLLQPDISFDEETRTSFIQTIDSEADRLSHLIDDLLLMSRIEAGAYKARKEWYDIADIIDGIKDRLYSIAIKHNFRLFVDDILPPVLVDGPRIGEVITNLVENAVKYSAEGTEKKLAVEKQDDRLLVHVSDQGLGIPEDSLNKVFERFYRMPTIVINARDSVWAFHLPRYNENHGGKIWRRAAWDRVPDSASACR